MSIFTRKTVWKGFVIAFGGNTYFTMVSKITGGFFGKEVEIEFSESAPESAPLKKHIFPLLEEMKRKSKNKTFVASIEIIIG